jgi:hypothetical protein
MAEINFTLVQRKANPWVQLGLALATGFSGMLIIKIAGVIGGAEYFAAMVGIILYTIMNIVVSIAHGSFLRYTIPSFYTYILLVVILFLSAKFLSGISIWQLTEYRMMLFSVTLFYTIASILVRMLRLIYELAEKDF